MATKSEEKSAKGGSASGGKKEDRKYIYAVGRRKTASAQVRLFPKGKGEIIVNGKKYNEYFPSLLQSDKLLHPLKTAGLEGKADVTVVVKGGGLNGQAEAVRLGIARALVKLDEENKKAMRAEGFLTRDPRKKERKKPGLRKARRAPQWSKR